MNTAAYGDRPQPRGRPRGRIRQSIATRAAPPQVGSARDRAGLGRLVRAGVSAAATRRARVRVSRPVAALIARWADERRAVRASRRGSAPGSRLRRLACRCTGSGWRCRCSHRWRWLAYIATIVGMSLLVAATTSTLAHCAGASRIGRWRCCSRRRGSRLEIFLAYFSDLAFPWFPLGLAVATHPALAQAADVSGVHGLSVWIAATNGLLADAWLLWRRGGDASPTLRRAVRPVALAAALCAAVWAYGMWRLRTVTLEPLARVGIVQPDISEDEKMQQEMRGRFIEPLAALTRQEEATGPPPQLVLWPETALPDFLINHPAWTDSLRSLARTGHRADSVRPHRLHGHRARTIGLRVLQRCDGRRYQWADRRRAGVPQGLPGAHRRARAVPQSAVVRGRKALPSVAPVLRRIRTRHIRACPSRSRSGRSAC